MNQFNMEDHPHRRFNALTGDWVLVSPHRAKRPWQGQVEKGQAEQLPAYDAGCYLCPGNERAGGQLNPPYAETFVFTNDFSALMQNTPNGHVSDGDLFLAESERGICKVICFSPRHDLTIPEMPIESVSGVIDVWEREYREIGKESFINYVQIFENKGAVMGCSNPHPHGQIWASSSIPSEPMKEQNRQFDYFNKHGVTLLGDYLKRELEKNERIVYENDHFVVLSPYWAVWPFETMIVSRKPLQHLSQFSKDEKKGLADAYKQLTIRYDNLFETSFPYSAGIHQSPTDGQLHPEWHFHMHFYPPLLRSATVKKFMVGYEMLATPQRDITPETSARRLRETSDKHYKNRG